MKTPKPKTMRARDIGALVIIFLGGILYPVKASAVPDATEYGSSPATVRIFVNECAGKLSPAERTKRASLPVFSFHQKGHVLRATQLVSKVPYLTGGQDNSAQIVMASASQWPNDISTCNGFDHYPTFHHRGFSVPFVDEQVDDFVSFQRNIPNNKMRTMRSVKLASGQINGLLQTVGLDSKNDGLKSPYKGQSARQFYQPPIGLLFLSSLLLICGGFLIISWGWKYFDIKRQFLGAALLIGGLAWSCSGYFLWIVW